MKRSAAGGLVFDWIAGGTLALAAGTGLLLSGCGPSSQQEPDAVIATSPSPSPTARPSDVMNGGNATPRQIGAPGKPSPEPSPQLQILTSDKLTTDEMKQHLGEPGVAKITWSTESEQNSFGFQIMRAKTPEGPFQAVNKTIVMGQGNSSTHSAYEVYDLNVKVGETYYYQVNLISMSGAVEPYPATARVTVNRLYLGGGEKGKANDRELMPRKEVPATTSTLGMGPDYFRQLQAKKAAREQALVKEQLDQTRARFVAERAAH